MRSRRSSRYRSGSSFKAFVSALTVSELPRVESTVAGSAGEGSFDSDQAGSNRATGSRDGGAGEGRGDEPTQYRPVALEIAYAIV